MKDLILIVFLLILYSCSQGSNTPTGYTEVKNKNFLSFKDSIMNQQPDTLENIKSIVEEPIISRHIKDTTYYYTYILLSSCSTYDGNIEIEGNSIFLDYWASNGIVCTERELRKLTFKVINKEQKEYKVGLRNKF